MLFICFIKLALEIENDLRLQGSEGKPGVTPNPSSGRISQCPRNPFTEGLCLKEKYDNATSNAPKRPALFSIKAQMSLVSRYCTYACIWGYTMAINVILQHDCSGFDPAFWLGPFCVHVTLLPVWVSCWCSGFFPQPRLNIQTRLIGYFKLPVGVNVSVNDVLSLCEPSDSLATCLGCTPHLAPDSSWPWQIRL